MFASVRKSPERLRAIERVTQWTRERFKLPKEATVFVSEIACPLPGCPPLETVVAFWIAEQRYQFRLFKPVAEVVLDDLPFAWLKDALEAQEGVGWDCC
jgi:nitrate reductase delta subunit